MKTIRCAIYTRKSTEEGLNQVFNTLDAQREACEAYVKSQAGEGWRPLSVHYDDGGFSGGNMDRPAIQRLLADVDAGKVDAIAVYKVDRLTRSLMDFARIVERLDARGVSFVSVTQAFNTTTSMGRLTLNVLLSFAQFEREVTGERIRDKIAASKAKGMWMGGNLPLGYDLHDRKLVTNPAEAEQVRRIFRRFVELGSGLKLAQELQADGVTSKRWISRFGQERGGKPISCGADRAQEVLASNRRTRRGRVTRNSKCPLAGLVYAGAHEQLTTSFSYGRGGRMYRYYVSPQLTPAGASKGTAEMAVRIPAAPLEKLVLNSIAHLLRGEPAWSDVQALVERVECREGSIQLILKAECILEPCELLAAGVERLQGRLENARLAEDTDGKLRLVLDRKASFRGGAKESLSPVAVAGGEIARRLRRAHTLLLAHCMSPLEPDAHALAQAPSWQRDRQLMHLGLISPRLQKRISGRARGENGAHLANPASLPLSWVDQHSLHDSRNS